MFNGLPGIIFNFYFNFFCVEVSGVKKRFNLRIEYALLELAFTHSLSDKAQGNMTTPQSATEITLDSQAPFEVKLLPPALKNELFDLNLAYFKQQTPKLHQKISTHQNSRFQLCLNPDDSINIYEISEKKALYPGSQTLIDQHFAILGKTLKLKIGLNTIFLGLDEESRNKIKNQPLHASLQQTLFNNSHLTTIYNPDKGNLDISPEQVDFLPLLRIYGIGLGNHIVDIVQRYDIACLIINEPEFDLFYCSLYTTPWHQILPYFYNDANRSVLLNFDAPRVAIQAEKKLLQPLHPFFYSAKASLAGSLQRDFSQLTALQEEFDRQRFSLLATGWYDDQATGLRHAIENINRHNPFYTGKKLAKNMRVFLVGSGPSLNDSIDYLKQHADDAFIIACGSSISTLLSQGVTPQVHILQERPNDREFLLHYADESTYQNITCIKLNVVSAFVDDLYRETLVLQKANDPGSTLLPLEQFPQSYNVNPTVTNTGITLCTLIGAREVFLFGIDYGSSENYSTIRADGTVLFKDDKVDKNKSVVLKGNFGKKVYAHEFFAWSLKAAEAAIAEAKPQSIHWINIGDGAEIAHTQVMKPEKLPQKLSQNPEPAAILERIRGLFSRDYRLESIAAQLQQVHIPATQDFLLALLDCFDTVPQSRVGLMTTISLISQAANTGADEPAYLPKKLFGVEFVSFLDILYVQICTTQSDAQAIELYRNAIPVIKQHAEAIFQDFLQIAETLGNE